MPLGPGMANQSIIQFAKDGLDNMHQVRFQPRLVGAFSYPVLYAMSRHRGCSGSNADPCHGSAPTSLMGIVSTNRRQAGLSHPLMNHGIGEMPSSP